MQDLAESLSFVGDGYINGILLIIFGVIALIFGLEKVLDKIPGIGGKIDVEDFDSKVMRWLTGLFSIFAVIWVFLIWFANVEYHWFTVLLLFAYSIVLLSHPIRELEGWKIFLLFIPIILISFGALFISGNKQVRFVGNIIIPLWLIFLVVSLIFIILFLIIFFVEETAVDPFLYIIGWSPWVVILSILVLLQGLAMILSDGDISGLGHYFSDLISNTTDDIGGSGI